MTDSEIIETINGIFVNSFEIPPEKITPQSRIFDDLGLDSLDIVDFVAAIQKEFSVQIRDDQRVRSIRTMQDLYSYMILIRGEQKSRDPMAHPQASSNPFLHFLSLLCLNFFFWLTVPLVTIAFLTIAIPYVLLFWLLSQNHRRAKRLLRRAISRYGALVLKCAWPFVRIHYVDCAPDAKPPFIFVANHVSASDAFLMACLPFECIQVINNWPQKIPVFGTIANFAGYLKVRQMPLDAFLHAASKILAEGASIITFPEGTRSASRHLGPFHGTAFRLAQHARATIVPLAISGNENIPKKHSLILRPGRIIISKLSPITPDQYKDLTPYALKILVREKIRLQLQIQSPFPSSSSTPVC